MNYNWRKVTLGWACAI